MLEFKSSVSFRLIKGEWIGWIYPALIEHMISEANYFKRKLDGSDFTPEEEINYINHHHGEELGATEKLIDPTEKEDSDLVRSYARKEMIDWSDADKQVLEHTDFDPQNKTRILELSIKYGNEVIALSENTKHKLDNNQLKSIILPMLAVHAHREYLRFTERLRQLQ